MGSCNSGVRQGHVLSITLFNIYIDDLAKEIKYMNLGIPVNIFLVLILLYADDIDLLAENEADLQCMTNKLHAWCKNGEWRSINQKQILFILEIRVHTTIMCFTLGENVLNKVEKYKYLWVILNEYLEYDTTSTILSEAAGRALGVVVANTRHFSDLGFKTF